MPPPSSRATPEAEPSKNRAWPRSRILFMILVRPRCAAAPPPANAAAALCRPAASLCHAYSSRNFPLSDSDFQANLAEMKVFPHLYGRCGWQATGPCLVGQRADPSMCPMTRPECGFVARRFCHYSFQDCSLHLRVGGAFHFAATPGPWQVRTSIASHSGGSRARAADGRFALVRRVDRYRDAKSSLTVVRYGQINSFQCTFSGCLLGPRRCFAKCPNRYSREQDSVPFAGSF